MASLFFPVFHGVPSGADVFCEDKSIRGFISSRYYSLSKQFGKASDYVYEVASHTINGERYYFYSLLRCRDVLDYNSRSGSYIGFTIATNVLLNHTNFILDYMTFFYETHICESLLRNGSNGSCKFKVQRFEDVQNLKSIEQTFLSMLQNLLNITPIPVSPQKVLKDSEVFLRLSSIDSSDEIIVKSLSEGKGVFISDSFPSSQFNKSVCSLNKSLAQKDKELANLETSLKKHFEGEIREYENKISEQESQYKDLQKSNQDNQAIIKDRDEKIRSLSLKNQSLSQRLSHIKSEVDKITGPLSDAEKSGENGTCEMEGKDESSDKSSVLSVIKKMDVRNIAIVFLSLVILILSFFVVFSQRSQSDSSSSLAKPHNSITPVLVSPSQTSTVQDTSVKDSIGQER